jgi:non-heme chloroperoxidase
VESFVADDGERIYLRISGSGSPLILLHGWTSSHTVWNPLIEVLQQRHQVFCPDARGHRGHLLTVTQTPDVSRLACDVLNLMDHYGIQKAAIAGHSMGALTLWQFIRDVGCERLSHICIIDQSPKLMTDASWSNGIYGEFDDVRSQQLIDDLETDFSEAVLRLIAYGLNAKARETYQRNSRGWQQSRLNLRKLVPEPLIAIWKSLVAADFRDVLPGIDVPTLVVWGAESNFYTSATAQFLLDQIPMATLEIYVGSDHCPQLQQPQRFASTLAAFIAVPQGERFSAKSVHPLVAEQGAKWRQKRVSACGSWSLQHSCILGPHGPPISPLM